MPFFADIETGELWASVDESRTDWPTASAGHAIRSSHGHGAYGHGADGHGAAQMSGINEILSFLHRLGRVDVTIPTDLGQSAFRPFWMFVGSPPASVRCTVGRHWFGGRNERHEETRYRLDRDRQDGVSDDPPAHRCRLQHTGHGQ
ncbi:hypothetical protein CHELA40_15578 [Chelatococcus asaccharovorans]|nr:hypothetical protein CHELA17_60036 [Chelatococcus asaccharovorans]CAH1682936.1 hypothetical protein CHELA40_15578 [Chelatococcus asaccharovorans]